MAAVALHFEHFSQRGRIGGDEGARSAGGRGNHRRALVRQQGWQEATVKSLLNRLLKKGAISAERTGRRYLYAPVLKRGDWLEAIWTYTAP